MGCVAPAQVVGFARLLEALEHILADCLQHPVALVRKAEEALLDERLQRVEVCIRHLFCRFERAAPGEYGQAGKEGLLVLFEQLVRPLDGGAERLLAGLRVAASLQQVEPLR